MTRRTASSMTEVLVTLLVLAVCLTSAIALYPLATITVGQALANDRAVSCAGTGDGYIRDYHNRNVVEVGDNSSEPYYIALDNGVAGAPPIPKNSADPSYPVIIDPVGYFARLGQPGQSRFGDNGGTNIPRCSLNTFANDKKDAAAEHAIRLFYQLDGLNYDQDGIVQQGVGMRELRYSWLFVVQRPVNRDRYNLTLDVIVFDKRHPLYAPPGAESVYWAVFTPGRTAITNVPTTAEVTKGSWVMDATVIPGTTIRHAKAYRVVGVTEVADAGGAITYTLELDKPVRRVDGRSSDSNPAAFAYNGTLVVLKGVFAVLERPMLTGTGR